MKQVNLWVATLNCIFILISCQKATDSKASGDWLIPVDEIYDGGPGKDGIPALTNPSFVNSSEANYLSDNDLVIGIKIGDEIKAYPHPILDWHEIINDEISGIKFAITYCPLTGSGIGWNRVIQEKTTTFGVSGLLYNSNLIPYDRATDSNWSQMKLLCVNGKLKGQLVEVIPVIETTWKTWKEIYPQSKVVSKNTGYSRDYGDYPYVYNNRDYRTDNDLLLFRISNDDKRLPRKERVNGIIVGDKAKVYSINTFSDSISTINDNFNNVSIVAVGSRAKNFVVIYERKLSDEKILTFIPLQNKFPAVMIDSEGTVWDIFGKGLDGSRKGSELKPTRSYITYWFAWGTFFPGAEIYSK